VEFVEDCLPLLIMVAPEKYGEAELREIETLFKHLWAKGSRYALLHLPAPDGKSPSPQERQRFQAWASKPDILGPTQSLCVTVAMVTPSALARGALTALLWIWTPPVPLVAVASPNEGIENCLASLLSANVLTKEREAALRTKAIGACSTRFRT
jgi:hypothetical protein